MPLPVVVLLGPQLDGLEVAARVRLGEDHGAGDLAGGQVRQVLGLDLLGGEGVDRLGDALEAEDVHQAGVGPADHLDGHGVDEVGEVEPAEPVREGEAHQVGLAEQRCCRATSRRSVTVPSSLRVLPSRSTYSSLIQNKL